MFLMLLFLLNLSIEVSFPIIWGWSLFFHQYGAFTNWTTITTIIFHALQLAAIGEATKRVSMLALLHLSFECAFIFNTVSVLIYWPVVHQTEIIRYVVPVELLWMYAVHIIPPLTMLASYVMLDVRLKGDHLKPLLVFFACYITLNCIVTKINGSPVYDFLDWKDLRTPLICVFLMVAFAGFFRVFVELSFKIKPPGLKLKELS